MENKGKLILNVNVNVKVHETIKKNRFHKNMLLAISIWPAAIIPTSKLGNYHDFIVNS